jgi:hypothetical protein
LISSQAQESIIVEKTKINWKDYPELFLDKDRSEFKDNYQLLAYVDMYEITYLSDGLKIQSYAAIPRKEGMYPVIIFKRGGGKSKGKDEIGGKDVMVKKEKRNLLV